MTNQPDGAEENKPGKPQEIKIIGRFVEAGDKSRIILYPNKNDWNAIKSEVDKSAQDFAKRLIEGATGSLAALLYNVLHYELPVAHQIIILLWDPVPANDEAKIVSQYHLLKSQAELKACISLIEKKRVEDWPTLGKQTILGIEGKSAADCAEKFCFEVLRMTQGLPADPLTQEVSTDPPESYHVRIVKKLTERIQAKLVKSDDEKADWGKDILLERQNKERLKEDVEHVAAALEAEKTDYEKI
ncbi:MAG TPA: hypothetical protein VMG59_06905 [Phycisphaerae bacterium]|nr:hypothetical protein [Phycisphaerae bacterium]